MIVQIQQIRITDDDGDQVILSQFDSGVLIKTKAKDFYLNTPNEVIRFIQALKEVAGIEDKI